MAKLTLTFKGRPIRAYQFETGDCVSIGRDTENGIQIDSLAVAPVHAEIRFGETNSLLVQKHEDFPLQVNNVPTKEHELKHGDQIAIGKHFLYFTEETTLLEIPASESLEDSDDSEHKLLDDRLKNVSQFLEGQLQIMNGRNIGRVVSLKGGLTRLGKPDTGVAVIAKRKDGFYIACLDGGTQVRLNGQVVCDKSVRLEVGDLVEIDQTEMQFFINQRSPECMESECGEG